MLCSTGNETFVRGYFTEDTEDLHLDSKSVEVGRT